jgi:hypothetical protein
VSLSASGCLKCRTSLLCILHIIQFRT